MVNHVPDVSITRDWTRPNPLAIENLDSSKSYRWVDKNNIEQRRYEGWEVVRGEGVIHNNPDGDSGRDTREYRELMLCEMPVEKAEARNRYYQTRAKIAQEAAKQQFHREGLRMGMETFE